MGVIQTNNNGTVTFHLKGYKPIACNCISKNIINGIEVVSYESNLSSDDRNLLNNEIVSKLIKKLNTTNLQ